MDDKKSFRAGRRCGVWKPVGGGFIIVKEFYGSFAGNETGEAGNFIPPREITPLFERRRQLRDDFAGEPRSLS